MKTKTQFAIRHATSADLRMLEVAYGKMLRWLDGQHFNILPTFSNVEWMALHIFQPALEDGRSCIQIVESGEDIASILFWVIDPEVMELRYKTATSYGQWVEENYRGNKLVPRMIFEAVQVSRKKGVQRIVDMVHTDKARKQAEELGFKVDPNTVVLEI